jgi:hypothetical protein
MDSAGSGFPLAIYVAIEKKNLLQSIIQFVRYRYVLNLFPLIFLVFDKIARIRIRYRIRNSELRTWIWGANRLRIYHNK